MFDIKIASLPRIPEPLATVLGKLRAQAIQHCPAVEIEEIRLFCNRRTVVRSGGRSYPINDQCTREELNGMLRAFCGGSIYAHVQSINQGFISFGNGIRIGVCGRAAREGDGILGVVDPCGLVIRIPHAVPVSPAPLLNPLLHSARTGGVLLYAPPGVGKTTLLRAAAKEAASPRCGFRTVVVDTREELAFGLDGQDLDLNLLSGYPRKTGIEIAVRTLGADLVVCDEIGTLDDAEAILEAAGCGVPLLASAHASDLDELLLRPAFEKLHRARVFGTYVGMQRLPNGTCSFSIRSGREAERSDKRGQF